MKKLSPKIYIKNRFVASLFARLSGEYIKAIKYSLMAFKVSGITGLVDFNKKLEKISSVE